MKNKNVIITLILTVFLGLGITTSAMSQGDVNDEVAKVPVVNADVPLTIELPFLYSQISVTDSVLKDYKKLETVSDTQSTTKEKPLTKNVQKDEVKSDASKATVKPVKAEVKVKKESFKTYDIPLSADLQKYIYKISKEYKVDYELVLGLMEVESHYKSNLISKTHDYGLAQINQVNHGHVKKYMKKKYGINWDWSNPYHNALASVYMLDMSRNGKEISTEKMLLIYNMGEGNARKYLKSHSAGDWKYVKKVLAAKTAIEEGGRH